MNFSSRISITFSVLNRNLSFLPKTSRALNLFIGTLSVSFMLRHLNIMFGPDGVIMYTSIQVINIILANLEFGQFSSLISTINNRNKSLEVRFTLGKIYASVGLVFSFGLLPISVIYAIFSHQHFYFSFFTIALLSLNALCIFILKTYIAQSKQNKYFIVTSISHLSNPVFGVDFSNHQFNSSSGNFSLDCNKLFDKFCLGIPLYLAKSGKTLLATTSAN